MEVSQYLEIFIDESADHLQTLKDCIMTLESEPDNKDTINEVFRAAHSLKGMAGTMGFKRMQHLTHDMENVFQEVRSDKIKVDSAMIDLLFECLDAIEGYLNNIKATSDEGTDDNEVIIKTLNDFLAKANGQAAAEPAAPAAEAAPAKEEAPKEEAAAAEHKYAKMEFSDHEKKDIEAAREEGNKIYGLTVYVQKDCLLKAARAFLVFREVGELGRIVVYRPSSQDIEDERFELDFTIFVASTETLDKLIAAAKGVSEIENVVGGEIPEEKKEEHEADAAKTETSASKKEENKPAASGNAPAK